MGFDTPEAAPGSELLGFRVGDLVRHPFRDESVPILAIGTEVYRFVNRAYMHEKKTVKTGSYEAIEGSPEFKELSKDERFVKEYFKSEPSAEIDLSTDIERRTVVVPLVHLKKG
jgi:hypothetical protein